MRDLPGGVCARREGARAAGMLACLPQSLCRPLAAFSLCLPALPHCPLKVFTSPSILSHRARVIWESGSPEEAGWCPAKGTLVVYGRVFCDVKYEGLICCPMCTLSPLQKCSKGHSSIRDSLKVPARAPSWVSLDSRKIRLELALQLTRMKVSSTVA